MTARPLPATQQGRRARYLRETGRPTETPARIPPQPERAAVTPAPAPPDRPSLLPRLLPARKPRQIYFRKNMSRLDIAREDGYRTGLQLRSTCPYCYDSSAEWLAWYEGWKQGNSEAIEKRRAAGLALTTSERKALP